MSSSKTSIVLLVNAPLPTSVMLDILIQGMEEKHEFIVGVDAAGIKLEMEVEVEPADDGGTKVIKQVKVNSSSYKQKSAEHQAEADEVAANFKIKQD